MINKLRLENFRGVKEGEIKREVDNLICNEGDTLMLFAESNYDDFLEKWIYQEL